MIKNHKNNKVDNVFVLMVFCMFALSVFLVLMLGGSIYGNMIDASIEGQNERIALSYISTKIRSIDTADSISISDFNGLRALTLSEVIDGQVFVTYIYLYNGWVYELFHEEGLVFLPEDGRGIIRSGSLDFEMIDNRLIRVSTDYGSLLILPRSRLRFEGGY
ncbi:MAG: DUF4860 domain-containing protein [Defluviitaleaceae bacterium]|nr:DUF4860 domain-containing protein [Defluviitaleaceae bacterium]